MRKTAPAKINLTLDILGRRPDGYHEIATTMHQVDLTDAVEVHSRASGIVVQHDQPGLSSGEDNLAYRAARLLRDQAGLSRGLLIRLEKHIPLAAGLAGGSADAAAVLQGINQLCALRMEEAELRDVAAQLGSDVPFCLTGGTAFCTGRGEIVQPLPDFAGPRLIFVLVTPDFLVPTASVFAAFRPEAVTSRPDEANFQRAFRQGDLMAVTAGMANVLESVSLRLWPEIGRLQQQLAELGALKAQMSGSGPTVFGVFADEVSAERAERVLKQDYRQVFRCHSYL